MPIPSSPAEWGAIFPNDDDFALTTAWVEGPEVLLDTLAAASRLLERERCVEALAKSDACPILWSSEGTDERRREWARRILEVRP